MKHVSESIAAYLGGELGDEAAARVRAHLEACPQCRSEHDEARDLWDLLGEAGAAPAVGPSVWPQVRERTIGRSEAAGGWFFGRNPTMQAGLAAAAMAAGVVVGSLVPGGPSLVGDGSDALAADDGSGWLEASWLDSSDSGEGLAEQWLLAGLDQTGSDEQEDAR